MADPTHHDDPAALSEAAPAPTDAASPRRSKKADAKAPISKRKLFGYTVLGVVAALVLGWFTGILAGKVFGPSDATASSTSAAPSSTGGPATGGGTTPGEAIQIANATLYDPPPGDGEENPDRIDLSYDGKPGTTWPTLQYQGTAKFGNIKPGVGIIYDLGEAKTISQVKIQTTIPGATVEIRVGNGTNGPIDSFNVVAGPTELTEATDLPLAAGTQAQYVLVWITELVQQQGFYQASLSEVQIIS